MENPEIIRFQLDGFGRDLERGDLKRESKSLTAEGVFIQNETSCEEK